MSEATTTHDGVGQDTAPGPLPESLYGDLPDWDFTLMPSSTTVIMAALFLALGLTVNMQITERIDTALWGGVSPLFGFFFMPMWVFSGAAFFGVTGAVVVANINPIVANLTATNPLAPTFFATNTLYGVTMALFIWYFKRPGSGISFSQAAIGHAIAIILTAIPIAFVHIYVVQFTMDVVAFWFAAGVLFGWAGLFVTYPFAKKLLEAGVVQR